MCKIMFVVNTADFFLSHRLVIALQCQKAGYEVHIATAAGEGVKKLRSFGFIIHEINFSRSGHNLFSELFTFLNLYKLFFSIKPSIIHAITIKPVLYGSIASRFFSKTRYIAAISGLGSSFTDKSIVGSIRRFFIIFLYRIGMRRENAFLIFQNPDDKQALFDAKVATNERSIIIRGSGVDLEQYSYVPETALRPLKVVMAARLLKEKGVYEFVAASKILRARGVSVEMNLAGLPDPGNPSSITLEELRTWKRELDVNVLGFVDDVAQLYTEANIVCLPSYYGEGLPKSLVEAAACGRAVVTTNSPGCNYAIIDGVTGFLVPARNSDALADALENLLTNDSLREGMGRAGRKFAEQNFCLDEVVNIHMSLYQKLLKV